MAASPRRLLRGHECSVSLPLNFLIPIPLFRPFFANHTTTQRPQPILRRLPGLPRIRPPPHPLPLHHRLDRLPADLPPILHVYRRQRPDRQRPFPALLHRRLGPPRYLDSRNLMVQAVLAVCARSGAGHWGWHGLGLWSRGTGDDDVFHKTFGYSDGDRQCGWSSRGDGFPGDM